MFERLGTFYPLEIEDRPKNKDHPRALLSKRRVIRETLLRQRPLRKVGVSPMLPPPERPAEYSPRSLDQKSTFPRLLREGLKAHAPQSLEMQYKSSQQRIRAQMPKQETFFSSILPDDTSYFSCPDQDAPAASVAVGTRLSL